MKVGYMKKNLVMTLLTASLVCSFVPATVYATEVGTAGDTYVEGEDRVEEDISNEGNASYVVPDDVISKEDFYNSTEGSGNANDNEFVVEIPEAELDLSGQGQLRIAIEVSESFYENIQVTLYNRDTREEIKVPVYAANKWIENVEVPAGRYLVSNVLAGGDDISDPKWQFEMGASVDVNTDGTASLHVKLLKGPDFSAELEDTTCEPNENVTDTEIKEEDIKEEELTLGQQALNFLKSLVTGSNFFILAVLGVSSVGYLYLKKKREG